MRVGTTHAALASYREALAIYERPETAPAIGSTLISIGNVEFMQADYEASTGSYRRALTCWKAPSISGPSRWPKRAWPAYYSAQGNLPAALEMYTTVLDEARARERAGARPAIDLAATLESIGELHYRLGNVDQARAPSMKHGR